MLISQVYRPGLVVLWTWSADHVQVCDSAVNVCDSTGPYPAESLQLLTLWSGRERRQSWHMSLTGWERIVCEWPGAGWDVLNHLHRVSLGLHHAWICTSACLHLCPCTRPDLCTVFVWRMQALELVPANAKIHIQTLIYLYPKLLCTMILWPRTKLKYLEL